jgi:ElaB/YqjD/DUF883 family membrane-anchored ribosome-binding protein
MADEVRGKIMDSAERSSQRVSEMGRDAAEKLDNSRSAAARGIDSAASALRDAADSVPGNAGKGFARATAERLNTTADYVRSNRMSDMADDVMRLIKDRPGLSLIVAAALGFVVGRALTRS